MNLYVWKYLDHLSTNWHNGGGVMVIAATVERARELVPYYEADKSGPKRTWNDENSTPDIVLALSDPAEESATVFEDAGCC